MPYLLRPRTAEGAPLLENTRAELGRYFGAAVFSTGAAGMSIGLLIEWSRVIRPYSRRGRFAVLVILLGCQIEALASRRNPKSPGKCTVFFAFQAFNSPLDSTKTLKI
jgi:hypothetical protein